MKGTKMNPSVISTETLDPAALYEALQVLSKRADEAPISPPVHRRPGRKPRMGSPRIINGALGFYAGEHDYCQHPIYLSKDLLDSFHVGVRKEKKNWRYRLYMRLADKLKQMG